MKWHIVWVMWSRGAQVSSPLSFFAQTQRELYWIRERQSLREHVYVDIEPRCLDERTVFSRAPAAPGRAVFTLKPSSGSACSAETAAHFVAPEPCVWGDVFWVKRTALGGFVAPSDCQTVWMWQRLHAGCFMLILHIQQHKVHMETWHRVWADRACLLLK